MNNRLRVNTDLASSDSQLESQNSDDVSSEYDDEVEDLNNKDKD